MADESDYLVTVVNKRGEKVGEWYYSNFVRSDQPNRPLDVRLLSQIENLVAIDIVREKRLKAIKHKIEELSEQANCIKTNQFCD